MPAPSTDEDPIPPLRPWLERFEELEARRDLSHPAPTPRPEHVNCPHQPHQGACLCGYVLNRDAGKCPW